MAVHLYPFSLDSETVYIASAINATAEQSSIGLLQEVDSAADFYSRSALVSPSISQTAQRNVYLDFFP